MKKRIIALIAAGLMFSFGSLAIAGGGSGNATVTGFYEGGAASDDYSSKTPGNDGAIASSNGIAYGTVATSASAAPIKIWCFTIPGYAYETGGLTGMDESSAKTDVNDSGYTSAAEASAATNGHIIGGGLALGLCGDRETVVTNLSVSGNVAQETWVNEIGYPNGSGIGAQQMSNGYFMNESSDYASGRGLAIGADCLSGGISTQGSSIVTINPGVSISGYAQNSVTTNAKNLVASNVSGSGMVSGIITNGNSFAGGTTTFSYNGGVSGSGNASLNGNISTTGNMTVISVHGSSQATVNGSIGDPR